MFSLEKGKLRVILLMCSNIQQEKMDPDSPQWCLLTGQEEMGKTETKETASEHSRVLLAFFF